MFILTKQFKFEASHQLIGHDGKCARLHGHSWILTIEVEGRELMADGPKAGMLMDYSYIKTLVQPIVDGHLDHWHLNESLKSERPTSEFVAAWVYKNVKPLLSQLRAVTVSETCTTACRYQEQA